MARCKDCIHEIVCSALIEKGLPWNDGEYPAEAFCTAFQNKIVRCKDCKHYKPQTKSKRWDNKTKYCCRGTTVKVKDNDFCSYGEPKMKGGE